MEQLLLSKKNSTLISKSIIIDLVLLGVIYLLPTISHFLVFPLYLLEPMRIVIFASIILSRNKYNSCLLAVTIPLFSYFFGAHPVFLKSILIGIELLINVLLFWTLLQRWKNVFYVTFISIFVAKLVYYALKYMCVTFGWIHLDIISTSIPLQILVACIISGIMFFSKVTDLDPTRR